MFKNWTFYDRLNKQTDEFERSPVSWDGYRNSRSLRTTHKTYHG